MIKSLDHIVLTVRSINKTKLFYSEILGLKYEEFKDDDTDAYRIIGAQPFEKFEQVLNELK